MVICTYIYVIHTAVVVHQVPLRRSMDNKRVSLCGMADDFLLVLLSAGSTYIFSKERNGGRNPGCCGKNLSTASPSVDEKLYALLPNVYTFRSFVHRSVVNILH